MAKNFKFWGKTVSIDTASAALTSGKPSVQEGFFGIVLNSQLLNEKAELGVEGVYNIAVPASTAKGELLYVPSSAGGVLLTEVADATASLTRTSSNTNAPVCVALEARRADGTADVKLLPRAASRAATQV